MSKLVRPPQERSRQTRDLLVDATLDCLQEFGFHGASLSRILERAGVSKGTWAHHFATRNELIAAAAEVMIAETRRAADEFAAAERHHDPVLIEKIWQKFYQSRYRDVLFELTVACRTEADLRGRLGPVFAGLIGGIQEAWRGSGDDAAQDMAANIATLTVYMLRGMAVQDMLAGDPTGGATLRRLWSDLMQPFMSAGAGGKIAPMKRAVDG
ncbi:MAG TPA: TetR/AcrR family transcriptional regulator [Aliidongia sp.]|uniref:TetR/AcrR family transcriptional regulator n=1 Tax=Aliidongia sp. TaxID=1914230 RepID=UPI002DDC9738|nr:TetR/AcrR family transcriptional regulator [Aliidongia sp.]HEV2677628.1 TetR/AcrR family transcriptional regulator [Aliidongia sp.]